MKLATVLHVLTPPPRCALFLARFATAHALVYLEANYGSLFLVIVR